MDLGMWTLLGVLVEVDFVYNLFASVVVHGHISSASSIPHLLQKTTSPVYYLGWYD